MLPYGDAGILVRFEGGDRELRWRSARDLGAALRASAPTGVADVVASFASVFVAFDPLVTDAAALADVIGSLERDEDRREPREFTVPVVYGGEAGPDLELVAQGLGLSPEEVVALHVSQPWIVRFVGSPAGAPLMEGPEIASKIPRLSTPRARVQPGSVGLSGAQCIVYNAPSPGGWKLIGRTPLQLFDVDAPPHVAYRPGDRVRFTPIDQDEWSAWAGRHLTEGGDR